LLIYDEVMTGFRVGISGAQGIQGVTPDITTLGKVIGGGMPMGAFGARREIMDKLAPLGPVYQAGTLSGNPVSVAAGIRTLQLIQEPEFFDDLTKVTRRLVDGMTEMARKNSVDFCADAVGGMFGIYFSRSIPESFSDVMASDRERFNQFFHLMLDRGVYLAPSAFEAGFVSSAHSEADIAATLDAADEAFAEL
jgi:glutamate-1-semialdehyde 2,1-aminomutase